MSRPCPLPLTTSTTVTDADSLRSAFLHWQCLIRQYSARRNDARPSPGMTPELLLGNSLLVAARPVTLLNRLPDRSSAPEFRHLHRRTQDPRERRDAVISLLAGTHFQKPARFSDLLSAVFAADSAVAASATREGSRCTLRFQEHGRRFTLVCRANLAESGHAVREESYWFARLFNPRLPPDCRIVVFRPDWRRSRAGGG